MLIKGENFTRQKNIKSFSAITNIFDISSEDDRIVRMFEQLNCELENEYWDIIDDIENNDTISVKSYAYLLQIVPNFMARADYWRGFIKSILDSDLRENFLKTTFRFLVSSDEEMKNIENKDYFKIVAEGAIDDDKINRVLLYFIAYLHRVIENFEIVILEAPEDKGWFTTDNPVIFYDNKGQGGFGLCGVDSEFYLPLSRRYLAYFHHPNSNYKKPIYRTLENKKKYQILDLISEAEFDKLGKEVILKNQSSLVILPFELRYRSEINQKKLN